MTPDACDRRCLQAIARAEAYRAVCYRDHERGRLHADRPRDAYCEDFALRDALQRCAGVGYPRQCEGLCADACGLVARWLYLPQWPLHPSRVTLECLRDLLRVARGDRPEVRRIAVCIVPGRWVAVSPPYLGQGATEKDAARDVADQIMEDRRGSFPPVGPEDGHE